ncbi:MAG: FtsB family cell division protein [Desulfitobacteriia bacterium]|jgi:cell division protein FtsB
MLVAERKHNYDELIGRQYVEEDVRKESVKRRSHTKKHSQKLRLQSLVIVLAIITMFGIIGAKTVHINIVKGAEIKALESELQALNIERDLLQVEVDRLRSVARIEKAALAMGMEKPEETIYIAEDLIPLEKAAGVDQTQEIAVTPSESETNSVVDKIFHVFTSFFGSTQR